ncbi:MULTISPECIES: copper homeostasis membrane protein CopD [unclassified Bradyrhizobium]|uniref:copper homeostasis membrane protein CopD n=1 Tax=unclassified Bradyrhizobium TaxID=2631580 RepID=UPI0024B1F2DF|nr:copper homeostasis membrane protein CopD [Bradyrhizobium sp. CB2312]WFU70621.1 copper homeostasis membrane protein CopD [Bradyrhizobium sp. CB2312]
MDWSATGVAMVAARAIHFAATAVIVGTLVFRTNIAKAALRSKENVAIPFWTQTLHLLWACLAVGVISGLVWLLLQAVSMSGLPFGEAVSADVLSTVLNETQFGRLMEVRAGLAVALAACLAFDRAALAEWLALAAGLGLAASLAWTGHAGSTLGAMGDVHLAADALHLIAAATWIGGLVSLVLFFAAARNQATAWAPVAGDAAERFSILGMVSVATLSVTGIVNAWILVGSFRGLFTTEYGRVLMLKLGIFAAMLAVAAINRFYLMPRLALPSATGVQSDSLRQLTRNSVIEIALGLTILAIVGMLGMMHPAVHLVST